MDVATSNTANELTSVIHSSTLSGAELALSLFGAAANNYRHEFLLKPFPPDYISSSRVKNIDLLRDVFNSLPSLKSVLDGEQELTSLQKELVLWVLKSYRTELVPVSLDKMGDLQRLTGENTPVPAPQHVYKLRYGDSNEEHFRELRAERDVLFAYHGSRAENFYSIVHHGLHAHMNERSLFGEGTYLSVEPTVSLDYSPWGGTGRPPCSHLSSSVSLMALCEVIDHPEGVKHCTYPMSAASRRPQIKDIPDKYLLVTNNDMLRVRYLLVYTKRRAPVRRAGSLRQRALAFAHRHSTAVPAIMYLLVLLLVSLLNSKCFWKSVMRICGLGFIPGGWSDSIFF